MKYLFFALVFSLSLPLLASDHDDHDEFPEGVLLVLEGKDAVTRKDCALFVMDIGFTGTEETTDQFYAVVLTSYTHGEDKPDAITVKFNAQNNSVLTGTGSDQKNQIVLLTEPESQNLTKVKSFNLRWLHGNHYHNNRCVNLKVHEH